MAAAGRYLFPGMDPWLEDPYHWRSVHDSLIIHMAEAITAQTAPRYVAVPGHRVVLEFPEEFSDEVRKESRWPDVGVLKARGAGPTAGTAVALETDAAVILEPEELRETFVEVLDVRRDKRVVTVIEVLSHGNKGAGSDAREKYLRKQAEALASEVSLVEVDLLRGGEHTVAIPRASMARLGRHDYRVVVRRAQAGYRAEVYPVGLRRRLPRVAVPLVRPDPDAVLDVQALLEGVYVAGRYDVLVDRARTPDPPLGTEETAWAREILSTTPTTGR